MADDQGAFSEIVDGIADEIGELVSDLTGIPIPEPIKKNALKALGQLCTAAISVPVAYLEGKAEELKAASAGRVQAINASATQIANNLAVPDGYVRAAANKFAERIVQEQINLDAIGRIALDELRHTQTDHGSESPLISTEWINHFQGEAEHKTTDEMRAAFGKILAGEITSPGSFSVRTLQLLSQMDPITAGLFKRLCSLCSQVWIGPQLLDARVLSLGGNAAANSLQNYGLNFDHLNTLQEFGLIISDYNSWYPYGPLVAVDNNIGPCLKLNGGQWGFVSETLWPIGKPLQAHGVALTRTGKELLRVVDTDPDERYFNAFVAFFKSQGLTLTPATVKQS